MSEDNVAGPEMVVATDILKPPRARIGRIAGNLTLPRSVELRQVGAGAAGMVVGVMLWLFPVGILFSYRPMSLVYTAIAGTAAGVGVLYLEPLRGESVLTWARLTLEKRRGRVSYGGRDMRVYVGIGRLDRTALGTVTIMPSAVEVLPGTYDERGCPERVRGSRAEAPRHAASSQGFSSAKRLGS